VATISPDVKYMRKVVKFKAANYNFSLQGIKVIEKGFAEI
jgi:DNA topoisomerase IA